MGVPIVYRKGGEQILSSYDFVDIITGTGYIKLYGGMLVSGANLTNITYYSNPFTHDKITTSTTPAAIHDIDFDVTINRPITFKGDAIVQVPFSVLGSVSEGWGYIHARIRKWDGSTETEIANASGAMLIEPAGAADWDIAAIKIPVPLTHFKRGETLRLTIEGWSKIGGGGGSVTMALYFDPMNRDITGEAGHMSTITCQMPVRIAL